MAIFKRDGNQNQQQRRSEQNQGTLVRSEPSSQQLMRDPFSMMMRDPFQLMREMMIDPFRMFQMSPWGDVAREGRELVWNPRFDVRETDNAFVFEGDMPGIKQDDLEIQVVGNNLQITGQREREETRDEGTMHTYERSYGHFSRSFTLPESAAIDQIRGDLKDGVLTIVVPKKPGSTPQRRKIQIGAGSKA